MRKSVTSFVLVKNYLWADGREALNKSIQRGKIKFNIYILRQVSEQKSFAYC